MPSANEIILQYVCPTLGAIMASFFFAAPVKDLRIALINGSLGSLNPFPFPFVCGNCLGWTVYGYYTRDPFVVAANIPGLILSIWLNCGAAKLQYLTICESRKQRENSRIVWDASRPMEDSLADDHEVLLTDAELQEQEDMFVMVPQERALLRVLIVWTIVIIYVGWFTSYDPASIVGFIVNLNLVVLYGAPLQTMQHVISAKDSASIHTPTMIMNWLNTSFWISYGIARKDPIIIIPNTLGLTLGLIQGVLKFLYTSSTSSATNVDMQPIPSHDESERNERSQPPENEIPSVSTSSSLPTRARTASVR